MPTTEDTPAAAAARDLQGAAGTSLLLTQDSFGEERRANAADDKLTATALFCSPPAAQGSKQRSGNATGHTAIDGARTGDVGTVGGALTGTANGADSSRAGVVGNASGALTETTGGADNAPAGTANNANDALTDTVDEAIFGTQATGASDDGTNDASPSLTQGETVDGGNEGEERGRDPGPIAQEEGGTVRARDVEGEEDLGCQVLHACDNQLVAVYGDSIHQNDGWHLDGDVADNKVWQRRYDRVVAHPHPMYNPPKGGLGHRVVLTLAKEFKGVRE